MKKITTLLFFVLSACIFSCSKSKSEISPEAKEFNDKVVLYDIIPNSDSSKVILSWSKLISPDFLNYEIYYTEDPEVVYQTGNKKFSLIGAFKNSTQNALEVPIPYGPFFRYVVVGALNNSQTPRIISNSKDIKFENRNLLSIKPYEIFYLPEQKQFIVFSKKQAILCLYDQDAKLIKQTTIQNSNLAKQIYCFPGLGKYNNQTEIYIPIDDKVLIYDTKNLNLIDEFRTESDRNFAVSFYANKLFVSSYNPALMGYDRKEKNQLSNSQYNSYQNRVQPVKNKISNFINAFSISTNVIPVQLSVSYFNDNGKFISTKEDSYHGDYELNPHLFKVSPNGLFFITDFSGVIYNYDLKFVKYLNNLQRNNQSYNDFEFNTDGTELYAAARNTNAIYVFDENQNLKKTISLKYYPIRIFKTSDTEIMALVTTSPFNINGSYQYSLETNSEYYRMWFERVKL